MKSEINFLLLLEILFLTLNILDCCGTRVEGRKCPGYCTVDITACKNQGGKIVGYCTNTKACCDLTILKIGSCGDKKSGVKTAIFRSPNYPDLNSGDLVCQFKLELSDSFAGIKVEFKDVIMDGVGFIDQSPCDGDAIFLRGFTLWSPPPKCGNLTGYSAIIDRSLQTEGMTSLTVLAVMSSPNYKWEIEISQIFHSDVTNDTKVSKSKGITREFTPDYYQMDDGEKDDSNHDWETPLVVNGEDAQISTFPWQASLRVMYPDRLRKLYNYSTLQQLYQSNCSIDEGRHFCGGSIISNRFILSAAHCFIQPSSKLRTPLNLRSVKVVVGDTNICTDDDAENGSIPQFYDVEGLYFHYGYDQPTIMNDIVVIKLKKEIVFNDIVKAVALPAKDKQFTGNVLLSGWGRDNLTSETKLPDNLQSGELTIQSRHYCLHQYAMYNRNYNIMKDYPKYLHWFDSIFCTKGNKLNKRSFTVSGHGDSGGPLVSFDPQNDTTQPVLVGVVSYAIPVFGATHQHDNIWLDFFQSVAFYRSWIDVALVA